MGAERTAAGPNKPCRRPRPTRRPGRRPSRRLPPARPPHDRKVALKKSVALASATGPKGSGVGTAFDHVQRRGRLRVPRLGLRTAVLAWVRYERVRATESVFCLD